MITQSPFGRTGHLSTRASSARRPLSRVTQDEADRTLDLLLQLRRQPHRHRLQLRRRRNCASARG